MAVVKLHKASDGSLHETYEAYAKHEQVLRIKPAVAELVIPTVKFPCDGGVFSSDDRGNYVLFPEDIPAWVAQNADSLREILNDAKMPMRGRKAKPFKPTAVQG